jgi:hypothetical protein
MLSLTQVRWVAEEHMTGEFKAFFHSLRSEDLQEAFIYFSNRVSNLKGLLTRLLTGHETLIRGKVRNVLRDVSASIARISGF